MNFTITFSIKTVLFKRCFPILLGQSQASVKLVDKQGQLYIETDRIEVNKPHTDLNSTMDDKLKLLLGSACFQFGQPIAIECFSSSSLDDIMPKWRKMHSTNSNIIPTSPSPNILFINEFKPQNVGVYLCRTKDIHDRVVEVGVEFKIDPKNFTLVVVNSMEESVVGEEEAEEEERDEEKDDGLPNIRITFSDKLALARGERVELVCESGELIFENKLDGILVKRNQMILKISMRKLNGTVFRRMIRNDWRNSSPTQLL